MVMHSIDNLKVQLCDWLRRNELDGDLNFWTRAEWQSRGEEYLNNADFIITTEGGLHYLLNYAYDNPKVEELQDLLASFGFWFEMGHSWSIGVYYDECYNGESTSTSYSGKLRDPRWKLKADTVKAKADFCCQDCGKIGIPLEIHHCWYQYGLEPWQYPFDALRCLCPACHKIRKNEDHDFRCLIAEFSGNELARIRECIRQLIYWYDRSAAMAFVDAIGPDNVKMSKALNNLAKWKTEPGTM